MLHVEADRTRANADGRSRRAPHIIVAVLNHVRGHKAGVAGIYNRSAYFKEKREALELWANPPGGDRRESLWRECHNPEAEAGVAHPLRAVRFRCEILSGASVSVVQARLLHCRKAARSARAAAFLLLDLRFCVSHRGAERSHKDFTSVGSRGFRNFDAYVSIGPSAGSRKQHENERDRTPFSNR